MKIPPSMPWTGSINQQHLEPADFFELERVWLHGAVKSRMKSGAKQADTSRAKGPPGANCIW